MEIVQFHLESLGHASYLVGSDRTGEALVLDPRRDVDVYLEAAREKGYRIRWVVDSHQHNDYLSGLRELVERTGAEALGSAVANLGYHHRSVKDGEQLELGEVGFEVLHTPGHTPEHVSLLVYDGELSADVPAMLLSGGALLVGDLARPDLLGGEDETREAAQAFCRTLQEKILPLPDHTLVYPTHVAGSLCGGDIGSRLSTTVGYEKRTNRILQEITDKDDFVRECIRMDNLPAVPPYWPRMRSRNAEGVEPLGAVDPPPPLSVDGLLAAREDGAIVLDARSPEAYQGGHIPGALQVGLSSSFATWAGTVLPEGARVVLVLDDVDGLMDATWQLLRIGYDAPVGYLSGGMQAWRTTGRDVETLPIATVAQVGDDLDAWHILDVRQPDEWAKGHAPGAQHITGAELPDRVDEVPTDRPVLVMCGSGYRSTVASALLRHHGHDDITNLTGGWSAWVSADLPVESGS